jgi:DNA-binding CsgD family transcriptional regulator
LRQARDRGLLIEETSGRFQLRFRHALTREAIAGGTLRIEAARMHERAALALAALPDSGARVEELAHHWWEAGNAEKIREYGERAGDAAASFKAHADAQLHYERALEHASEDSERATLLMKIGHAARARGESPKATEVYERALRLRREIGDYDGAADAVAFLITERLNAGTNFRVGAEMLAAADADFGASCSPLARARLTVVLAQFYAFVPQTEEALRTLEAIPADLPLTPNIEHLKVMVHMTAAFRAGKIDAWKEAVERLLELTLDTQISSRVNIGLTGIGLGQTEFAARELDLAVLHAETWEYGMAAAHARLVRAQLAYLSGRLDDARADVQAARASTSEIARSHVAWVGPLVGFALGDDVFFEETLDRARLERARREENSFEWDRLSTVAALDASLRGDAKLAATLALEAAEAQFDSFVAHVTFPILAELVELSQGPRLLERCAEILGAPSIDSATATTSLVEAVLARRRGEFAAAREAANVARQAYGRLGWHLLEAGAYAAAGDVDSAMALFRSLGALGFVRRLEGDSSATALQRSSGATLLSTRERSIADLVASGHPNAEIAERLGISPKTVEKHLTSIFAKLGFRSRSQIAAFVASNAKATRV